MIVTNIEVKEGETLEELIKEIGTEVKVEAMDIREA